MISWGVIRQGWAAITTFRCTVNAGHALLKYKKTPFLLYNQLIPGENTLTPKSAAQDDEMEALYWILEYPHFN